MEIHQLDDVLDRQAAGSRPYLEFLSVPDLSVGLYVLPPGAEDRQQPHAEDEVYHVVAGRARMTVGDETADVRPGTVVYVAAHVAHRFHDIAEELRILVFFAPAESTPTPGVA
jgi:mannose-6-phosphate isomerase-like protein (cupin superfamily)